jgi:flagellar protein FlaG
MKIEGSLAQVKALEPVNDAEGYKAITSQSSDIQQSEDIWQTVNIDEKAMNEAINDANKVLSIVNRGMEFSIHEETGRTLVRIVDKNTDEVIREIPPEKLLDMLAKIWKAVGLIIDKKA